MTMVYLRFDEDLIPVLRLPGLLVAKDRSGILYHISNKVKEIGDYEVVGVHDGILVLKSPIGYLFYDPAREEFTDFRTFPPSDFPYKSGQTLIGDEKTVYCDGNNDGEYSPCLGIPYYDVLDLNPDNDTVYLVLRHPKGSAVAQAKCVGNASHTCMMSVSNVVPASPQHVALFHTKTGQIYIVYGDGRLINAMRLDSTQDDEEIDFQSVTGEKIYPVAQPVRNTDFLAVADSKGFIRYIVRYPLY
ncbi:MAG: hypothetical protein ABGW50_02035 [Thermococcus sp.]